MLMTRERRSSIRTLRGWAISVLQEAGAIHECEEHGWMQDRAEGLPRVQGDRVQLQQVMLNLIVNAIQSMSSVEDGNRELHISTVSIAPEGVCVAVRDTSQG